MTLIWLEPWRLWSALSATAVYAALCLWAWLRQRRLLAVAAEAPDWTVAYASQSGNAEALARQAAQALGHSQRAGCLPLDALDAARLERGGRFLFVVSTHGAGEAPDNARRFVRTLLPRSLDLAGLEFALLALGDRGYADFCAFGRQLVQWLERHGARASFPPIEVDRLDKAALNAWRGHLAALAGADDLPAGDDDFLPWKVVDRQILNPGSQGEPVHQLRLQPVGHRAHWQSGDLAWVLPPVADEAPRAYSIASLPEEGELRLLVRRALGPDGRVGLVSGWLGDLSAGCEVSLAVRPHPAFRQEGNQLRPAIFIGNGVGLSGLRAHLAARIAQGNGDNWLIFGERNAASDFFWRDELEAWVSAGQLAVLNTAFSRDGGAARYVQDLLVLQADKVGRWLARGAAIYVCGSRQGMGEAVDGWLRELLGEEGLNALALEGRYCRDVF